MTTTTNDLTPEQRPEHSCCGQYLALSMQCAQCGRICTCDGCVIERGGLEAVQLFVARMRELEDARSVLAALSELAASPPNPVSGAEFIETMREAVPDAFADLCLECCEPSCPGDHGVAASSEVDKPPDWQVPPAHIPVVESQEMPAHDEPAAASLPAAEERRFEGRLEREETRSGPESTVHREFEGTLRHISAPYLGEGTWDLVASLGGERISYDDEWFAGLDGCYVRIAVDVLPLAADRDESLRKSVKWHREMARHFEREAEKLVEVMKPPSGTGSEGDEIAITELGPAGAEGNKPSEAASMPSAAISYIERDGRLLCVWNRRYGCWTLPGGKLEPGESKEAAQVRELAEETGMGTAVAELVYEAPSMSGRIVAAFRVDVVGEPRQAEPSSPIGWLTREELIRWSRFADFYRGMFAAIDGPGGSR